MDAPVPALVIAAGNATQFAWDEFVYAKLRNPHTRKNYRHAVTQFLDWCQSVGLDLVRIAPRDVGRYLDELAYSPATKKLHLAALRHFFDQLVLRHVVILNPAASVRSERLQVLEGKTPEITVAQARKLLGAIDTSSTVGLRDQAIIATLIYTAARVGAVAKLRRGDFYDLGDQYCLRLTEKGTKSREIPVRHDLRQVVLAYLDASSTQYSDKSMPLFRTTVRRTGRLKERGMTSGDMARMVKRRLADAGLPTRMAA